MRPNDLKVARDHENPDPHELHKPIPKILVLLVVALLGWAVYYIAHQSPGTGSSSQGGDAPVPASAAR